VQSGDVSLVAVRFIALLVRQLLRHRPCNEYHLRQFQRAEWHDHWLLKPKAVVRKRTFVL